MYSGKKAIVFSLFGIAFGYFCHRMILLYDSLPNQPPIEKIAYLFSDGQKVLMQQPWEFGFTKRSLLALSQGFCLCAWSIFMFRQGRKSTVKERNMARHALGQERKRDSFTVKIPLTTRF